ncbi:hypothetical protein RSAG8_13302, partial [Rhizoctonia solani AG-8 WAC10335]
MRCPGWLPGIIATCSPVALSKPIVSMLSSRCVCSIVRIISANIKLARRRAVSETGARSGASRLPRVFVPPGNL